MIPFSPPRMDQLIIDEVVAALKSGWITTGPRTRQFERNLTGYCGCKATLCVNSATSGLEIMLRWFGVGPGDEVIIPAYTYAATANVVVHCGAKPVMIDIGPDFNINTANIAAAITERTKVIIPVDFGGYPCDYQAIHEIVNRPSSLRLFKPHGEIQEKLKRILIVSDAAHSIGATVNGNKTGSLTDVSVFSFHAVKNLTTAEGGAIALNLPPPFDNEEVYRFLCVYTLHGQNKDALAKLQKGNWKYDVVNAGYKCNMTDLTAAIGLVELSRYDTDMLVRRKYICEFYNDYFSRFDWAHLPLQKSAHRESSYHLYPLRMHHVTEAQRDEIIQSVFNRDVSVNVHFIPLPMLSFYMQAGYRIDHFPAAYQAYASEISLPVFYDLTEAQMQTVCKAVSDAVEEVLIQKS